MSADRICRSVRPECQGDADSGTSKGNGHKVLSIDNRQFDSDMSRRSRIVPRGNRMIRALDQRWRSDQRKGRSLLIESRFETKRLLATRTLKYVELQRSSASVIIARSIDRSHHQRDRRRSYLPIRRVHIGAIANCCPITAANSPDDATPDNPAYG